MNKSQLIKQQLKGKTEEKVLRTECQDCHTEGRWSVKVTEGVNLISKTKTTPAKRNFEEPIFGVSVTCIVCGYAKIEMVEATP
jgi:hypothetical protein